MAHKFGFDIGNSSIKWCSDLGIGEIPAWRARGHISRVVADTSSEVSDIRFRGEDLILGQDAVLGSNFVWKTDEEKSDEINVAFILLALARKGITEADIVLGLPVSTAASKTKVAKVKETYSGIKEAVIGGRPMVFILNIKILAEPLGTYLSLVMDDECRLDKNNPYYQEQLAIVDIGYRTVDIVVLEKGGLSTIQNSSMSGMVRYFDKIKSDLESTHGKMRPNEEVRIQHGIIHQFGKGTLKINGEQVSSGFWNRAAQYKAQIARDLSDEIHVTLSDIRPDRVLLTGGGALLLKEELLGSNRHFMVHPNPRYSNVIGFYRAARTISENNSTGSSNAEDRDRIDTIQSR